MHAASDALARPPSADAAARPFGDLAPLLAPRSVAVIGASEREGNLGGLAVRFLAKFGYAGPVWPVNPTRAAVHGYAGYASLAELPGVPDLAIVAVPAPSVQDVARQCADAGVPAAIVWAGGFAEAGADGIARQQALAALCRDAGIRLLGPNCIGVINTALGLTASFSSMLTEQPSLVPGAVSMVSQSGGIAVMAHARAQAFGLGFRVTVSCGNEAVLRIGDVVRALAADDGTRVLAVYTEGLADPASFVAALDEAKRRGKPVVAIKGGASEASGRAALAHTGRLAGSDRIHDAVFREFGVIRVHSTEELLDVCLQLASAPRDPRPAGDRVVVTSFGGGSGVVATDQCAREGLALPALSPATCARLSPLVTPLSAVGNPVDFTPGMMTDARHRANLPAALAALADAPDVDGWLFLAAGFGKLAPELERMLDDVRQRTDKPLCVTWQAMPAGTPERLAARGLYVFTESARAARAMAHVVRRAARLRLAIRKGPPPPPFAWSAHVDTALASQVVPEDRVAAILEAAGLPVAPGRRATTEGEAIRAARDVGLPVAMKGLSPAVTHRAAAGLVALGVASDYAVAATMRALHARAASDGVALDGVWVQAMFAGERELIVTALADPDFGPVVGCGIGGALAEVADDVVFARAPIDAGGAYDLVGELSTLARHPSYLTEAQRRAAASFVAGLSALAATAPWPRFTLEVNPLKLAADRAAAVDGLLVVG